MKTNKPKTKRSPKVNGLSTTEKSKPSKRPSIVEKASIKEETRAWMEELVKTDPLEAIFESRELLNLGTDTLLKLNESIDPFFGAILADQAETSICNHTARMINELCRLAKSGRYWPVHSAWDGGKAIAKTIHDLALAGPLKELQRIARPSMTMPSLRAKPKKFTFDFKKVAETIQLAEDHPTNLGWDAKLSLDAVPTRIVVNIIDRITFLQQAVRTQQESLRKLQAIAASGRCKSSANFKRIRKLSLEDYLQNNYPGEVASDMILCRSLPPLTKETAKEWWDKAIKPWLEKPECLEQICGTPFYQELVKAATNSKTTKYYGIRDELKKRCQQVVLKTNSLFKPAAKS